MNQSPQKLISPTVHHQGTLREDLYRWQGHNPYDFLPREASLVEENLQQLLQGRQTLENFLRHTPQAARWNSSQVEQAHILLVTQEPGLSRVDRLYQDWPRWSSAGDVAAAFHNSMLSWLALRTHSTLEVINGETSWQEGEDWEISHPRLAVCGKVGYFLTLEECRRLAREKVLHIDIAPFAQKNGDDHNELNDGAVAKMVHRDNCDLVGRFAGLATKDKPRFLLMTGNRTVIEDLPEGRRLLKAQPDRNERLTELIRLALQSDTPVIVRLILEWFDKGKGSVVELSEARVELSGDISFRPRQVHTLHPKF